MSQRFAKIGCTLVLWDINEESNRETASQVQELGAKAHTYVVDLSKREDIYKAADKVCSYLKTEYVKDAIFPLTTISSINTQQFDYIKYLLTP